MVSEKTAETSTETNGGWRSRFDEMPLKGVRVWGHDVYYEHTGVCIVPPWSDTLVFTDGQKDDCKVLCWRPLSGSGMYPPNELLSRAKRQDR